MKNRKDTTSVFLPCDQMKSNIVMYARDLSFCCGDGGRKPGPRFGWKQDVTETMENFFVKKEILLQEINCEREFGLLKHCLGCRDLMRGTKKSSWGKIKHLNYGLLPTVCQSKCMYCSFTCDKIDNNAKLAKEAKHYEKLSGILDYLKTNNLMDENFSVQVASGEITIHPDRKRLFAALSDYVCQWYTNAFIYDARIAENIKNNRKSCIVVSLDCGTPKTFHKIKGFDIFQKVCENLKKYNECGNLVLKYIVLPGVNDSIEDYYGIIAFLNELALNKLILSRDTFTSYISHEHLESVAVLVNLCRTNNIYADTNSIFSIEENDIITRIASSSINESFIKHYYDNEIRNHFRVTQLNNINFTEEYRLYFEFLYLNEKHEEIRRLLDKSHGCAIWGAGMKGRILSKFLFDNGFRFHVTDRNPMLWGNELPCGVKILPWEYLSDKIDTIILSNSGFYDSVRNLVGNAYTIVDV
jgi:wyosine [tRNA(Phe)-imidazoG37] synthetase (radical SAM superfamily)